MPMREITPYIEGFDKLKNTVIEFTTRFVAFAKEHKAHFDELCAIYNDKMLNIDGIELDDPQEINTIMGIIDAYNRYEKEHQTIKTTAILARDKQLGLLGKECRQIHIDALQISIKSNKKRIESEKKSLTDKRKALLRRLKSSEINKAIALLEQCSREYEAENVIYQLKIIALEAQNKYYD
jgi:hypothetical protein